MTEYCVIRKDYLEELLQLIDEFMVDFPDYDANISACAISFSHKALKHTLDRWRVVPETLTSEMVKSGYAADIPEIVEGLYQDLLYAAPKHPAMEEDDE